MINFKELKVGEDFIERGYGFKLSWNEKIALSYYIQSFKKIAKETHLGDHGITTGIMQFLDDYFGIPVRDLEKVEIKTFKNKKVVWEYYGFGLDDHPNFKEYCKLKVNDWREERNLI